MLGSGSTCRLGFGLWTSDQSDPWPATFIDRLDSQSFILLDGGILEQYTTQSLAYQRPDRWTWCLFKQIVARLRRNRFNDLGGIMSDSLQKCSRTTAQGSATFIVGSTLPQVLGTNKFMILNILALFDGSAALLRPHCPRAATNAINLEQEIVTPDFEPNAVISWDEELGVKVERLKGKILRFRIQLRNLQRKHAAQQTAQDRDVEEWVKARKKLSCVHLALDCAVEELEELEFRRALSKAVESGSRWKEILQRLTKLNQKLVLCYSELILGIIISKIIPVDGHSHGNPDGNSVEKKQRLLQSYFNAWSSSEEACLYDLKQKRKDAVFGALDVIRNRVFGHGDQIEHSALTKRSDPEPEAGAATLTSSTKCSACYAGSNQKLFPSVKSSAGDFELGSVTKYEAGQQHEDLLESLKSQLESSYLEELQDEGSAGSFPDDIRTEPQAQTGSYKSLFSPLPPELQRQIDKRGSSAQNTVRFSAHTEVIGNCGCCAGISELKADESRRYVLENDGGYPVRVAMEFDVVAKTRRLVSSLTRRGKWYPNIRAFYDEFEDWLMRRPQLRCISSSGMLPWQLTSNRRDSCPAEFYHQYCWTVFPGDIIVVGNHSLWNCITSQELTNLVDCIYSLDSRSIARSITDLAARRRVEFPSLFKYSGPIVCIVCKVEVHPQALQQVPEKRSKSCAIL